MARRANPANPAAPGPAAPRPVTPCPAAHCADQPTRSPLTTDPSAGPPENVSRETMRRLELYAILVRKWTKSVNLVSQGDHDALWPRHVLDSLRLLPLIPGGATRAIDLGSGAGFPGLVLAL